MSEPAVPTLVGIGHLLPARTWGMAMHAHHHHELIVVMRGRLRVRISSGEHVGAPGDVLFYHAGAAHEEAADPTAALEIIYIGFTWSEAHERLPVRTQDRLGRLRQLATWLHAESHPASASTGGLRVSLLATIAAEWRRLAEQREPDLVERTRAFMRAHIASDLDLATIAAHAGLSRFHFLRRYRQLVGCTPIEDLRRLRVELARSLILTTHLPLKTIAEQVGFADQYHFSRTFRRVLRTTPGALRAQGGDATLGGG